MIALKNMFKSAAQKIKDFDRGTAKDIIKDPMNVIHAAGMGALGGVLGLVFNTLSQAGSPELSIAAGASATISSIYFMHRYGRSPS